MTTDDSVRVARCRALLAVKGAITRAELTHALDDPIPAPPTPAPTPEPTPAPPQTPEPTQAATRPGPGNTGVPAGTVLMRSGSITTRWDGQIIEGFDVLGMVKVQHNNVTIRRSRIKAKDDAAGSDYPIKIASGVTGTVIEDVEIDGSGRTSLCVGLKNFTLRRSNLHSAAGDFIRADGGCVIERNWLHDFVRVAGGHHDGIQILSGSGDVIRENAIDMLTDGDPGNACIIVSAQAPVSDLLIERNWLNGGNYTLYLGANTKGIAVERVAARDNIIGGWRYGPVTAKGTAQIAGNVDREGKPVT